MEYLARTIPTDASSRLVFTISCSAGTHELEFTVFPAWSDRVYRIEWSDLSAPVEWLPLEGEWVGQDGMRWSMIQPMPDRERRFYRLAVEAQ
jgi:hypothetical protein